MRTFKEMRNVDEVERAFEAVAFEAVKGEVAMGMGLLPDFDALNANMVQLGQAIEELGRS